MKKCPVCGSTKIATSVAEGKNGRKVRIFRCLRCGYTLVQALTPSPVTLFASREIFIPRYIYLYDIRDLPPLLRKQIPEKHKTADKGTK